MSKSMVIRWFFGSLIGLAGGSVLLVVAGAVALANDVFIMSGPDVVGIKSGALAWTLAGLVGLAMLAIMAAAVAMFVAWIGAVLNTAYLPSKTWCVALLVIGLLGLAFVATLAYVIAGPDGMSIESRPSGGFPRPLTGETAGYSAASSQSQSGQQTGSSGRRG
jgi:hypothetical protein